jgi:hypothetical protein
LRPPIAQERVQLVGDDLVRLELKRPFSDGTFAIELDSQSLLARRTRAPNAQFDRQVRVERTNVRL